MSDEPGINTSEAFVSEPIEPGAGTFGAAAMARGEPGVPGSFVWRDREYAVAQIIESWKSTGPDAWGGTVEYLRKHWYRVRTTTGETMTIYFDRQPPKGRRASRRRWTLFSMREPEP